jgi:hypothetical protein
VPAAAVAGGESKDDEGGDTHGGSVEGSPDAVVDKSIYERVLA